MKSLLLILILFVFLTCGQAATDAVEIASRAETAFGITAPILVMIAAFFMCKRVINKAINLPVSRDEKEDPF